MPDATRAAMTIAASTSSAALLDALATVGAAGASELAALARLGEGPARARLRALGADGLVQSARVLHGEPALHALTRRGLRAAGRPELAPVVVGPSNAAHLAAVGRVAAALAVGGARLQGERELRARERAAGRALASAEVGRAPDGSVALHRPDLVWLGEGLPLAIEVERTVKAPERLARIVRGWARSRLVSGVVYHATPAAMRALERAIAAEQATERVHLVALAPSSPDPSAP
jgi:hypothetical protein